MGTSVGFDAPSELHGDLRDLAATIANKYGHTYYLEKARSGGQTTELWADLAEAGLVGIAIPEEFGGGGQGVQELAIVCEELAAAGCPSFRLIVSISICAQLIAEFGTPEQKVEWLPELASGAKNFAFSITEPDAGLNTHNMSTTATRDGNVY